MLTPCSFEGILPHSYHSSDVGNFNGRRQGSRLQIVLMLSEILMRVAAMLLHSCPNFFQRAWSADQEDITAIAEARLQPPLHHQRSRRPVWA